MGFMLKHDCMSALESWEGVRTWVMPDRRRVEFWVWPGEECYKLEIAFEDVLEAVGCCLASQKLNALLLKVNERFLFLFVSVEISWETMRLLK